MSLSRDSIESLTDQVGEAKRQLLRCRQDAAVRLERAEQQRVRDMWSVIQAYGGGAEGSGSGSGPGSGSGSQSQSQSVGVAAANKAAWQRAHELEAELEALVVR